MTRILEITRLPRTGANFELIEYQDSLSNAGSDPLASDWGYAPMPLDENLFDRVYISHMLQYLPWYRAVTALRDVHRVLRPGGELEIYVPDFDALIQSYRKQICGDNWRPFNQAGGWMTWVNSRLFNCGPDASEAIPEEGQPWDHYKAAYDAGYLIARLTDAGFQSIECPLSERRNGPLPKVAEVAAIAIKPDETSAEPL